MFLKLLIDSFYGRSGAYWAALLLIVLLFIPKFSGNESYVLHLLFTIFIFATLGHAWNLMAGYAGLLSFGQQVFIGLGGFSQAIVYYYSPLSIWSSWPVAGVVSVLFGWLLCMPLVERGSKERVKTGIFIAVVLWAIYEWAIFKNPSMDIFSSDYTRRVMILLLIFLGALPLMRLKGAYFAIATWLIAESVSTVFNGWRIVGAGGGMQLKSDVTLTELYYVSLALLTVTTAIIWRWMRSPYGLALTAVRDDEDAAMSSGVDVHKVKSVVFLASSLISGLAAGLYFMDVVIVTPPSAFSISWASYIVFVVVAGGMGTVAGPIIGGVIFIIIDRVISPLSGQGLLVLGVLSILLMLILPRGFMGIIQELRAPNLKTRRFSIWNQWMVWLLGETASSNRAALADQPGVVGAYLIPASPLLLLKNHEPVYADLLKGMDRVAKEIAELQPDTIVVYSTKWLAVLDELWQARTRMSGVHVDENWHELGEMRFDIVCDVSLAKACARAANRSGIISKTVDYHGFPVDSGTLSANSILNPQGVIPLTIVANNLYHDFEKTKSLGEIVTAQAVSQGKRIVVLAVGGLSGSEFRDEREFSADAIFSTIEDEWNLRILKLIEARNLEEIVRQLPDFNLQAKTDMGFKHFAFALGAMGGRLGKTKVYAYGPQYGSGAAVIKLF